MDAFRRKQFANNSILRKLISSNLYLIVVQITIDYKPINNSISTQLTNYSFSPIELLINSYKNQLTCKLLINFLIK